MRRVRTERRAARAVAVAAVRRAGAGRARTGRAGTGRARFGLALAALAGLAGVIAGLAGCGSGPALATAGAVCGGARTAVNVAVVITVAEGTVDCGAALRVEQAYAAAIRSGDLQGNGGGAPVTVDGWSCQTYPTTKALRTRDASECHTARAEVVAVLASASPGS